MGRGMAASLARANTRVIQYDSDAFSLQKSVEQAPGLIYSATSVADVCERIDGGTVVVSVSGEAAERAVFFAADGILEQARKGSVILGCGTMTPSFAKEIHAALAEQGLRFLDAPVSGGPEGAANGMLTIMVGGGKETFEASREVMDTLGSRSVHLGGPGAGAAAKLVNQLLTASNALAASEALALARAMGIDSQDSLRTLLSTLETSWGNSTMLQRSGGIVAEALDGSKDPVEALAVISKAPLRNFAKDLDFVLAAADEAGLHLPTAVAARSVVSRAESADLGSMDWAYVTEMHQTDDLQQP